MIALFSFIGLASYSRFPSYERIAAPVNGEYSPVLLAICIFTFSTLFVMKKIRNAYWNPRLALIDAFVIHTVTSLASLFIVWLFFEPAVVTDVRGILVVQAGIAAVYFVVLNWLTVSPDFRLVTKSMLALKGALCEVSRIGDHSTRGRKPARDACNNAIASVTALLLEYDLPQAAKDKLNCWSDQLQEVETVLGKPTEAFRAELPMVMRKLEALDG
ncbi:MAG: hypothetical protein AAGL19_17155 [Pseudomonadota bacterium]